MVVDPVSRAAVIVGLCALSVGVSGSIAVASRAPQKQANSAASKSDEPKSAVPAFTEVEAAQLLDEMRHALETDSRRRFLKLFDAAKMPNYATFRDQMEEFFAKYDAIRVRYHLTQAVREGDVGVAVADFELEAAPDGGPSVRRNGPLRLGAVWDGKRWKMFEIEPRAMFR